MKKLFAILMVIALILPMGMVTQAAGAETKPFYLVNWSPSVDGADNVYQMPYIWTDNSRLETDILNSTSWGTDGSVEDLARALKELFDGMPEGTRYLNLQLTQQAIHELAEDVIYLDNAVAVTQEWMDAFFKEYKSIGGKMDGIANDVEYIYYSWYYINETFYKGQNDKLVYDRIVKNPHYETDIRPLLVERGFKFYPNPTESTPEIYSIYPGSGEEYAQSRNIWNNVVGTYFAEKIAESCAPALKYYPDLEINDYNTIATKPWINGDSGGVSSVGGLSSSNANYYQERFNLKSGTSTPDGYNGPGLADTPFNYFLCDINYFKEMYLASDNGKISFWAGPYLFNEENKNCTSHTPYYSEMLIHVGMMNPEVMFGYILEQDCRGEYDLCVKNADDVMKELTRMVGAADRKPIAVRSTWNDHYVLSGMSAGGKNVWRLTPDTSVISLSDFQVKGASDPTFTVNGQTITFPQGKIIADGKVAGFDANDKEITNNTCGFWIETPTNVMPVETRVQNYHSEYPTYGDDFEAYAAGTEYNYKNAKPAGSWQVSKKGKSSAVVTANGNDQVLAMSGTHTLKNVNIPQNITAGDTYAEHQAWEVSVTIPSDMAADAEVVVLNAVSEKRRVKDGGFKIAGGKLYYGKGEEYVEMTGVTVNAGTEYRLVRELDFTDEKALKSSYYVYDASGTLLGSAKKVEMVAIDLPITSVNLATKNVAGNPVLLDNYKLYPTKVATDFYLYTAKLGMPVADQTKAIGESAAYRLSWMNTTNDVKSYSVVAAYYNGDSKVSEEVVKELKLAPNTEGVETGIVELGSKGGAVLVYLRDNNPAEPDEDTGDTGNTNQGGNNQGGNNQGGSGNTDNTEPTTGDTEPTTGDTEPTTGTEPTQGTEPTTGNNDDNNQGNEKTGLSTGALIGIIAGVVVVLAGAAVAVVLLLKKKAAAEDAEEAPAAEEAPVAEEVPAEETVEEAQEDAE